MLRRVLRLGLGGHVGARVGRAPLALLRLVILVVDRDLPPDTGLPPPAPTGQYPANKAVVTIDQVKLMVNLIPRATRYELALETWTGKEWRVYTTWSSPDGFRATYPPRNTTYRFRARAQNAHGFGPWSPWAVFDYGKPTTPRPSP